MLFDEVVCHYLSSHTKIISIIRPGSAALVVAAKTHDELAENSTRL